MKLEVRAITKRDFERDSPVVMSSTMPSAKYSCSGSPLMFWNGNTAMDGLSGSGSARVWLTDEPDFAADVACPVSRTPHARIGSATFLRTYGPKSSQAI